MICFLLGYFDSDDCVYKLNSRFRTSLRNSLFPIIGLFIIYYNFYLRMK